MKKAILYVGLVCIMLVFLNCGCTENDGGSGNTITMTAKEFNEDMVSAPSETGFSMLYNSLQDGDVLIIQDNISEIEYDIKSNKSTVTLEWSEPEGEGTLTTSRYFEFEGIIAQYFQIEDYVRITVHVKHVTFLVDDFEYDLEIFEEQWISQEYFSENVPNFFLIYQGLKPLSQSCIGKLSGDSIQFSIISFDVDPDEVDLGETAELSWVVVGADSVEIDNGIGDVNPIGEQTIIPTESTTYTLAAINSTTIQTATAHIVVTNESELTTPEITFIQDDESDTLTVSFVDSPYILWKDIGKMSFGGHYGTSGLGTYVTIGDQITNCSGFIYLRYTPTESLLGTWWFTEPSELSITGTIDTTDGNIAITLEGDYLATDMTEIEIMDNTFSRTIIYLTQELSGVPFGQDFNFKWTDSNEDGNVGDGDLIEIYRMGGLDSGDWFLEIRDKPSGGTVYNSGAIKIS